MFLRLLRSSDTSNHGTGLRGYYQHYRPSNPDTALVTGLVAGGIIGALATALCLSSIRRARRVADSRRERRAQLHGERETSGHMRVPSPVMGSERGSDHLHPESH